jgi:hypothetical protein
VTVITKTHPSISIYCPKPGSKISFGVNLTRCGWQFDLGEWDMFTDKTAQDLCEYLRRHEDVSYPHSVGTYFEGLWDDIDLENLSAEQIQERLDEIADWISSCSERRPRW